MSKLVNTSPELRSAVAAARERGEGVGLVPTMGALHAGHLSLIEAARDSCDFVVVSIFVNPTQFGEGEDLDGYPRDLDRDRQLATDSGADLIYAPSADDVYPEGFSTRVEVEGLTDVLCGAPDARGADHFLGVTTVVAKLFNKVAPDLAFFGQKDAQQALVIKRMARDLDFDVGIRIMPTIRETDGLAMSSRNAYLDDEQRGRAAAINRALEAVRASIGSGTANAAVALGAGEAVLAEAGIDPEYFEARDAETLATLETFNGRPALIAIAAPVGRARLIDNLIIEPHPIKE